jgi:hypothetical protein
MPSMFFADLVREASHATGPGPMSLNGAVPGHRNFAAVVPPGASFHYAIAGITVPGEWETGVGTLDAAGALVRAAVAASSAGGALVAFSPGLKTVALTVGSSWFTAADAAEAAFALELAGKQPLSAGHIAAAQLVPGDQVTVARGAGWVNVPAAILAARGSDGRFTLDGPVAATPGNAALPGIGFAGDADSGLFAPEANCIALATGGEERWRVAATGNFGIGTGGSAPDARLSVWGADPQLRIRQTNATATPYGLELVAGGLVDASFKSLLTTGEVRITAGRSAGWGGHLTFFTDMAERLRITATGAVVPGSDNAQALGNGALRFATIYAGSGVINTSDARDKDWRGEMNAAERRAAQRIAETIGLFRWTDAIAAKGEDARMHVGVRAQAVWAIMADEGLVDPIGDDGVPGATPYGFLCWDKWDGGARFGVRSDQLALFIAAGQEARIAALEAAA